MISNQNQVYVVNVREETLKNPYYRRVIDTSPHQQLVLMSLKPKEDIKFEIHPDNDQHIRIEKGTAIALTGKNKDTKHVLTEGMCIVIPAGTWHQIINSSNTDYLKLYTIYSPADHPPGEIDVRRPQSGGSGSKTGDFKNKYYKYKYKYFKLRSTVPRELN